MKIKRIITLVLSFMIVIAITLLLISFNLKSILVNGVIKETIKTTITIGTFKEGNEIPKVTTNNEEVNKLLESKEVQDLMNKYLDKIINNLSSDEEIDEYEIEKDVISFLKENKEEIEEITGKEITNEQIDKTIELYEDNHISHSVEKAIKEAKENMTTKEKAALKGYSFIISTVFKVLMFILIIINLVLISVINKSRFMWINTLGVSMFTSGLLTTLIALITSLILRGSTGIKTINTNSLIIPSIIVGLIGLVISIVYRIVEYKRSDQNELPEFSEEGQ